MGKKLFYVPKNQETSSTTSNLDASVKNSNERDYIKTQDQNFGFMNSQEIYKLFAVFDGQLLSFDRNWSRLYSSVYCD